MQNFIKPNCVFWFDIDICRTSWWYAVVEHISKTKYVLAFYGLKKISRRTP